MSPQPGRIAVIGGGIAGLSAALDLARSPRVRITLFEKGPDIGGLCAPFRWNGLVLDRFYHILFPTDSATAAFIKDIGLESRLSWTAGQSGFYGQNRLVPFSSSKDFLRFPFLSLAAKVRLGLGIARTAFLKPPRDLRERTATEWMTSVFGRRVMQRFWRPLLRSKLGDALGRTSAHFPWALVRRYYHGRSGAGRSESMGAVPGGYAPILEAARAELLKRGVEIRTNTEVSSVSVERGRPAVRVAGEELNFDTVLLTIPNPEALRLLRPPEGPFRRSLETSLYLGVIVVLLVVKRSLSPFYVINLLDEDLPFTGVIESTNVLSPKDYGGRRLVYLPRYLPFDDPDFARSDASILQEFRDGLSRMFPEFRPDDVIHQEVFRAPYVQALPRPGDPPRPDTYATPWPNIYLANASSIDDSTLNNDAVIRMSARAVGEIRRDLGGKE